jgi:metal-sulfur cluster biosynthetic enzyme
MFIQVEATDDPARLRFLPGRTVLKRGTLEIRDTAGAARSPLAMRLFGVNGVAALSLGPDYIEITKSGGEWSHLKPALLGIIMQHFLTEAPVVSEAPAAGSLEADPAANVKEALRLVIDPELGYNIVDLGLVYEVTVADGAASIAMTTTTRGCPATDYLREGARNAAEGISGVTGVEVDLTYDPPWTPDMMSPEAKLHFGITE